MADETPLIMLITYMQEDEVEAEAIEATTAQKTADMAANEEEGVKVTGKEQIAEAEQGSERPR